MDESRGSKQLASRARRPGQGAAPSVAQIEREGIDIEQLQGLDVQLTKAGHTGLPVFSPDPPSSDG